MKFYSEDIELIRALLNTPKLDIYELHRTYQLSPAQVSRSVKKFEALGIINDNLGILSLKELGFHWVIKHRKELFLNEKNKYWKEVPDSMRSDSIEINELYLPKRNKLDKHIFKIEGREND